MVRSIDRPAMTIAVDLRRKATKQTNKQITVSLLLSHWYPGPGVVLDCIDS